MDPRIKKLAQTIIHHSTRLQAKERILIDAGGSDAYPLVEALVNEAYSVGAYPYVDLSDSRINRALIRGASAPQLDYDAGIALTRMEGMDAYVALRASMNIAEMSDVPKEQLLLQRKAYSKVLRQRVDHSKWVVLRYPNGSMAQLANMSTEAFEDFYFDVCTLDYTRMSTAMDALVTLLDKTDRVQLKGPGTDLTFSIKDIQAIKCAGEANLPDGEVYTAPVRDSVNGTITYNTPSMYQGTTFENVSFTFENGRIIKSSANHQEALDSILDTDEGARYIGEFAFGVNPLITKPMNDILFDEKIAGSIHFTPGSCYEDANNGNKSDVHWDLVLLQSPEYGGGEIYLDDRLIRKDGRFVLPELDSLNPEALL